MISVPRAAFGLAPVEAAATGSSRASRRFGLPVRNRLLHAPGAIAPDLVHIATESPLGYAALWPCQPPETGQAPITVKTRFIFNARSGRNARNPHLLLDRTRAFIAEHGLDADVVLTERPRHATELARRAIDDGCDPVVAIGGDGTLNETATALVGTGATLGLIPCGSGNGLGRHLGIPGPGRDAFRTLLHGRVRVIDTGLANGHPFFNAMGVGFDADLSARLNRLHRRGLPAYAGAAVRLLLGYRPETYAIRNGPTRLDTRAFIVAVANSDQYGNDCYIAPGASIDDGLLDLTVLRPSGLLHALPLAARLFRGTVDRSASAVRMRGARFAIERPAPGLFHTDGETHETGAVIDVAVRPRSLRILVPRDVSVTNEPPL